MTQNCRCFDLSVRKKRLPKAFVISHQNFFSLEISFHKFLFLASRPRLVNFRFFFVQKIGKKPNKREEKTINTFGPKMSIMISSII